jgi:predicted RNase H-like HicB family nuclease
MNLKIELEREEDGRWIAEIPEVAGCMTYGESREDAMAKVKALVFRVLADRFEHGEAVPAGTAS